VRGNSRQPLFAPAALLPTVVVLGLLVLVWAAVTGPVGVMSASGRRRTFSTATPTTASPTAEPSDPGNLREVTDDVSLRFDLGWLGDLIAYAGLIGVGVAVFLALRWLWLHRWHPPPRPPEVEFEVLPDQAVVIDALRRDAHARIAAVARGAPRDGIVQCWLRLEEAVASAGVPPYPYETSSEFVVRMLHALDLDPRATGRLASLYREARFSRHELGEDARTAARSALEQIDAELDARLDRQGQSP